MKKALRSSVVVLLILATIFSTFPCFALSNTLAEATAAVNDKVVYYEDFNYADNSGKQSVLSTLGWEEATELNPNNVSYSFVNGKLLCDSISTGATADSYVTVLSNAAMREVAKNDYTIAYKLTYIEAEAYNRYSALVYSYNGYKSYNSVHVRVAGYGNNQVRAVSKWYTYDTGSTACLDASGTSSVSYKLFGTQSVSANASTTTAYPFVNKELTIRIAVDVDTGASVYINGKLVSSTTSTYNELFLSANEYASAIALKTTKGVKAYMDDFIVYTGLGEIPTGITKEGVTYTPPTDNGDKNAIKVLTLNTLYKDQETDAFSNGINRTYHMANVVSGLHPDIVGMQERNAKNQTGVTSMLGSYAGYAVADEYRTDTSVANVVSYTPILYNTNRFSLVANATSNGNYAHGALLFEKSYNVKNLTATEIASFAGTKGLAWAVLKDKKTGNYVLALNAHFALNGSSYTGYSDEEAIEARLSNAAEAFGVMKKVYSYFGVIPTVFTGDFNMRFFDPAFKSLTEFFESSIYASRDFVKYEYSMNSVTNTGFNREPNVPIDHIFYTDQSLKPTSYYVGNKVPELRIASDHMPVMTTFSYADVAAPTPSHHTGVYSGTQYVTLEGKGLVYYTTDGTDPRVSATRKLYGEAISVNTDTIIKSCSYADGVYSEVDRVTLFFSSPLYITEAIKNTAGKDHTEGIEIINVSNVEVDLSDFMLWAYSNADEATCLAVTAASVTSQMKMAYHRDEYVLPSGQIAYCPMVYGDSYLSKDDISATESAYLVTLSPDGKSVTYHTDRYAAAIAYEGMGSISADRIFPIDRTARSIGYTDDGTLVKRMDYLNATDGQVNNIGKGFNLGNGNYTRLYITIVTDRDVSNPVCVASLDSTGGGITTVDSVTTVAAGAFNFTPGTGAALVTQGFTADRYTVGALTAEQEAAFASYLSVKNNKDGIAVSTPEQFAAMSASGSYYLAADISVDTTYSAVFTGVLDGRGHTVTASTPLFADMSGTVKNLVVKGNIAVSGTYNSAVAMQVTGTAVFEGIVVDATLSGGTSTGGIVGYGVGGCSIYAAHCINNGNHSGTGQVGGLIGYSQGKLLAVDECINYGNITSTSYTGGIVCRFGKNASAITYRCNITNCVNYGEITASGVRSAGIIGYTIGNITVSGCINYGYIHPIGTPDDFVAGGIYGQGGNTYTSNNTATNTKNSLAVSDCYNYGEVVGVCSAGGIVGRTPAVAPVSGYTYSITDCGNEGDISCVDSAGVLNMRGAGGIVGYFYGTTNHRISRCYNVGNVSVTANSAGAVIRAAGIASYFNGTAVYFSDCYNAGTITATGTNASAYQLYYNKHATGGSAAYINNNHALAVSGAVYETNGTQASSCTTFTAAELGNGSLKNRINSAAGRTVYFQQQGTETHPTLRVYHGFELWGTVAEEDSAYKVNGSYLYRVNELTTVAEVLDSFASFVWMRSGDTLLNHNEIVGTGFEVTSFDGQKKLTVIITGDTNSDGTITAADSLCIKYELRHIGSMNVPQFLAGDINDDGEITTLDYISIKQLVK